MTDLKFRAITSYLGGTAEKRVTNPRVINLQLIDTVHVRNLEFRPKDTISATLQGGTNKRVNPDELQLNVFSVKGNPLILFQFLNFNFIYL